VTVPRPTRRLAWALAWDLSPPRPDAFMAMDAQLWTEAVELRAAYEEGLLLAQAEVEMRERIQERGRSLSS
jgi:hypothetical protein